MFGAVLGAISGMVANGVEGFVEKKIEDMGRDLLADIISRTPLGMAFDVTNRLEQAIASGGSSELQKVLITSLRSLQPAPLPGSGFARRTGGGPGRAMRRQRRGQQDTTRQWWLDEGWKHNWRSQPRNSIGEWIAGRLPYPVTITLKVSRRVRRLRKRRRLYRSVGRKIGRQIVSSWHQHDGN